MKMIPHSAKPRSASSSAIRRSGRTGAATTSGSLREDMQVMVDRRTLAPLRPQGPPSFRLETQRVRRPYRSGAPIRQAFLP
ncbi:hypothetical protein GCM10010182_45830 [Actinomadura cremea]|nr:hypothetical protein GCM10010182_45830 [Actinomadura cremea]